LDISSFLFTFAENIKKMAKESNSKRAYWLFYDMLMTRREISLTDVGENYLGRPTQINPISRNDDELKLLKENLLKQAASNVIQKLNIIEPNSVKLLGNNRIRTYKYVGKQDDPLRDERNKDSQHGITNYSHFCKHVAGIIPSEWIEYYFRDTSNLPVMIHENECAQTKISTSLVSPSLVPSLLDSIINKRVLCFSYTNSRNTYFPEVIFHPQYLKEWAGRWFICGETDSFCEEEWYDGDPHFTLEVNRIGYIETIEAPYRESIENYWVDYFAPIVGCKREKQIHLSHVKLRTTSYVTYRLLIEHPIHSSQRYSGYFHDKQGYGEFEYDVSLNREFMGSVLNFGDTLKMVGDKEAVEWMKTMVKRIYIEYFGINSKSKT